MSKYGRRMADRIFSWRSPECAGEVGCTGVLCGGIDHDLATRKAVFDRYRFGDIDGNAIPGVGAGFGPDRGTMPLRRIYRRERLILPVAAT